MKLRILSMIMAMVSLTACVPCSTGNDEPIKEEPGNENPEPNPEPSTGGEGEVLVAYISCTNTTKGMAETVANITGGLKHTLKVAISKGKPSYLSAPHIQAA